MLPPKVRELLQPILCESDLNEANKCYNASQYLGNAKEAGAQILRNLIHDKCVKLICEKINGKTYEYETRDANAIKSMKDTITEVINLEELDQLSAKKILLERELSPYYVPDVLYKYGNEARTRMLEVTITKGKFLDGGIVDRDGIMKTVYRKHQQAGEVIGVIVVFHGGEYFSYFTEEPLTNFYDESLIGDFRFAIAAYEHQCSKLEVKPWETGGKVELNGKFFWNTANYVIKHFPTPFEEDCDARQEIKWEYKSEGAAKEEFKEHLERIYIPKDERGKISDFDESKMFDIQESSKIRVPREIDLRGKPNGVKAIFKSPFCITQRKAYYIPTTFLEDCVKNTANQTMMGEYLKYQSPIALTHGTKATVLQQKLIRECYSICLQFARTGKGKKHAECCEEFNNFQGIGRKKAKHEKIKEKTDVLSIGTSLRDIQRDYNEQTLYLAQHLKADARIKHRIQLEQLPLVEGKNKGEFVKSELDEIYINDALDKLEEVACKNYYEVAEILRNLGSNLLKRSDPDVYKPFLLTSSERMVPIEDIPAQYYSEYDKRLANVDEDPILEAAMEEEDVAADDDLDDYFDESTQKPTHEGFLKLDNGLYIKEGDKVMTRYKPCKVIYGIVIPGSSGKIVKESQPIWSVWAPCQNVVSYDAEGSPRYLDYPNGTQILGRDNRTYTFKISSTSATNLEGWNNLMFGLVPCLHHGAEWMYREGMMNKPKYTLAEFRNILSLDIVNKMKMMETVHTSMSLTVLCATSNVKMAEPIKRVWGKLFAYISVKNAQDKSLIVLNDGNGLLKDIHTQDHVCAYMFKNWLINAEKFGVIEPFVEDMDVG